MKKTLLSLMAVSALAFTACEKTEKLETTKATVTLMSASGAVSGITVYAYDQDTWNTIGDQENFAKGEATSNASGKAVFNNIEYPTVFNSINKNQNNFRFSAHYSINGTNKAKVKSVTVSKGDQVEVEIYLD